MFICPLGQCSTIIEIVIERGNIISAKYLENKIMLQITSNEKRVWEEDLKSLEMTPRKIGEYLCSDKH